MMHIEATQHSRMSGRSFSVDTTFVLFFLAMDFGQSLFSFGIDGIFAGITLVMVVVLPYFLPAIGEKPEFLNWLIGRGVIGMFATALGIMFHHAQGTVLPETFRSLPLTLLIVAAMISCYIQFYSLLRFRLAK